MKESIRRELARREFFGKDRKSWSRASRISNSFGIPIEKPVCARAIRRWSRISLRGLPEVHPGVSRKAARIERKRQAGHTEWFNGTVKPTIEREIRDNEAGERFLAKIKELF